MGRCVAVRGERGRIRSLRRAGRRARPLRVKRVSSPEGRVRRGRLRRGSGGAAEEGAAEEGVGGGRLRRGSGATVGLWPLGREERRARGGESPGDLRGEGEPLRGGEGARWGHLPGARREEAGGGA